MFYLMQVKGLNFQKLRKINNLNFSKSKDFSDCPGIFCKDQESTFVSGIKESLSKTKQILNFSYTGKIMFHIFKNYNIELEELK